MSEHTPKPWRISDHGDGTSLIYGTGGVDIADTRSSANQKANARLIAAAPDLLAALKTMSAMWHAYVGPDNYDGHAAKAFSDAVAAIQKATGNT